MVDLPSLQLEASPIETSMISETSRQSMSFVNGKLWFQFKNSVEMKEEMILDRCNEARATDVN